MHRNILMIVFTLILALLIAPFPYPINSRVYRVRSSIVISDDDGGNNIPFYVSWIIHIHQPLYNINGSITQLLESPNCPEWLPNVWRGRVNVYKNLIPSVALNMTGDEALQVDITGTLIQQLNELEEKEWDSCLYCGWKDKWIKAVNSKTSLGLPRLRILGAGYYHPIFPLLARTSFGQDIDEEIKKHREIIVNNFGVNPGPGFFPIEESYSPEIIPYIVKHGYKWIVVDSEQVLRATEGYNSGFQPQPNPIDIRNPNPGDWDWAVSPQLVFRPHVVEYNGSRIVVFVRYRHMSQAEMSGTSIDYLISQIKHFQQYNTDPKRPFIMVIVHDGENGWPMHNNGIDYYVNYLVGFLKRIHSDPSLSYIKVIGLDEYLAEVYNPLNDTEYEFSRIWIEPGSWETMGTWGDPLFAMWNYPDTNEPDQERWGLYVEAVNYYATVKLSGYNGGELSEALDWIMKGEGSDYYYWDGNKWWDTKSIYAFNKAKAILSNIINEYSISDNTPPTVRYAWRDPYNPSNNVVLYLQAYDISGISSIDIQVYHNGAFNTTIKAQPLGTNNFYTAVIPLVQGNYSFKVEVVDTIGNNAEYKIIPPLATITGTTPTPTPPPANQPFKMDGKLDCNCTLYINENNTYIQHLWGKLTSKGILYIATDKPSEDVDVFIIVALKLSNTTIQPPWKKNGSIMNYTFYLGYEGSNGWTGWFKAGDKLVDNGVGSASGEVIEGYINLTQLLGNTSHVVYVTVVVYQTSDHGSLLEVLINDNHDQIVEPSEFIDP